MSEPGLAIVTASGLEPLVERLAATLRQRPLPPLAHETVVVAQNVGLKAWVVRELARRLGVAASLDLLSPRDLATGLARELVRDGVPDDERAHPFEVAALTWRIRAALDDLPPDPVYDGVRVYLGRAAARGEAGLPLAVRLAELFDTYQVYRPDALAAWAEGRSVHDRWPDEPWQADLWRRLLADASCLDHATHLRRLIERLERSAPRAIAEGSSPREEGLGVVDPERPFGFEQRSSPPPGQGELEGVDRPERRARSSTTPIPSCPGGGLRRSQTASESSELIPLAADVARVGHPLPGLPPLEEGDGFLPVSRVSVFGALVFPPLYWRTLGALARHVPVTVYAVAHGLPGGLSTPSGGFAHPLLRDLGGQTRDWVGVVSDLGRPTVERAAPDPDPACALHRLQAAVADDVAPAEPEPCAASDRSIRALCCHSPLRELEVLRDEILDAFESLDDLTPGDVAVLVPDLGTYAPLVDAVFGAEDVGGARVPYHVVEHPLSPELRVLDAFHRLLALDGGRATATEVVGLLDVPSIRRRAEIREDELSTILEWVREARVHWGRDGDHKAAFGLARDDVHTWRFGLDRLLLGYAVCPTGDLVLDRLPVAEAALDGADLLGRFAEWAVSLFGRLDTLRASRPPAAWADALTAFADDVFEPRTDAEVTALVTLRTALDRLRSLGDDGAVPLADVRPHLAGALALPERHEPILTGKVTFADPLVLRHAPFRVLAVVGLGDAFPRSAARPDFDLLGVAPLPGDPDAHATDRQVFLDAVMAARERLLLSYVGRSHMDNAERAPSVVLDSLLDTCRRTFGAEATARFVVEHPLQPFSPTYFHHAAPGDHAPTHFTYADHHAPPALDGPPTVGLRFFETPDDLVLDSGDGAPAERVETTLAELARAWTQPCRYHCQHLDLDLRLDDAALDDDEPVILDGLAFHGVKTLVLEGLLRGEAQETIVARLVRSGRLPPGALGDVYVSRAFGAVAEVAGRIEAHGPTAPVPLVIEGVVWRVEGVVQASPEGVLRARASSVKGKDLVKGWIDHLAVCASESVEIARRTLVVGEGGASVFRDVPTDEARSVLQFLVRGMLLFREVPPPLFEQASYEQARAQKGTWQAAHETVVAAEEPGWRPVRTGRSVSHDNGDAAPYVQTTALKKYDGRYEDFSDTADPAVALCYRRREPLREMAASFDRWARMLWGPLLAHREDA